MGEKGILSELPLVDETAPVVCDGLCCNALPPGRNKVLRRVKANRKKHNTGNTVTPEGRTHQARECTHLCCHTNQKRVTKGSREPVISWGLPASATCDDLQLP
eukprot:13114219-Heterocapsa_arctica.AAC.1